HDLFFFSAYALLPLVIVLLVSFSLDRYSFFVPRYFLPFIVGVQMLLAVSLSRMKWWLAMVFLVLFTLHPLSKAMKHWRLPETSYSQLTVALQHHPDRLILHLTPMSYYPTRHYAQGRLSNQRVAWSATSGPGYVLDYNLQGEALNKDDLLDIDTQLLGQ